jgi:PAS domain S-box-containing protein
MKILFLNEHRCKCGKLLMRGILFDATLEIKCRRCGEVSTIGRIRLMDDTVNYLLIIDDQGRVTNVSDSACRILGYDGEELIGKNLAEISPAIPEEIQKKFLGPESVLGEENYFQLDTTHRSKDGGRIPVVVLLKQCFSTQQNRYVLVSVKLKDSVEEDKPLAPDEFEFAGNSCDYYFDVDRNGVEEYVSPSVEKVLGFPQETIIGKSYLDFLPAEKREEARKNFEYFSAKKQPYRMVCDVRVAADRTVNNELYFAPNFNGYGEFIGYRVSGWVRKNA